MFESIIIKKCRCFIKWLVKISKESIIHNICKNIMSVFEVSGKSSKIIGFIKSLMYFKAFDGYYENSVFFNYSQRIIENFCNLSNKGYNFAKDINKTSLNEKVYNKVFKPLDNFQSYFKALSIMASGFILLSITADAMLIHLNATIIIFKIISLIILLIFASIRDEVYDEMIKESKFCIALKYLFSIS